MYWVYKSYLFFVNKVWSSFVKMLFWSSVSLCTRAAIQLRNDSFCSHWTHTEVLNLISSGKFNDSCFLSLVGLICFFSKMFRNLTFCCLFLDIPIFTIFRGFCGLFETWVHFQRKPCPTDYLSLLVVINKHLLLPSSIYLLKVVMRDIFV